MLEFAVVLVVLGIVALAAGHLVPQMAFLVPVGWALFVFGLLLLVLAVLFGGVGDIDVGRERGAVGLLA